MFVNPIKCDTISERRHRHNNRFSGNKEYNEISEASDLQDAINNQITKGAAKFFDLNDFDCKYIILFSVIVLKFSNVFV